MVIIGGYGKIETKIRCQGTYRGRVCKKQLFIGSPGFDILTGKPKIQEIKCPRCGAINLIRCEFLENMIVTLKGEENVKKPLGEPGLEKQ